MIWIQLKETFRNKRFIFFTLILPLIWFFMLINILKGSGFYSEKLAYLLLYTSSIIGILGNSIITFSKTISDTNQFFQLQIKTTPYKTQNWLLDQIVIQTILNTAICLVVIATALLTNIIKFHLNNFFALPLLIFLGIYLCVFGFFLGMFFDSKTISALSMPLMMVIGLLIVPINTWFSGKFVEIVTAIQKAFPGYYLFEIIQKSTQNSSFATDFWKFILTLLLLIVPITVIFMKMRFQKSALKS